MSADATTLARYRSECAQRATELGMLLADCADRDTPLPDSLEVRRDEMIEALEDALTLLARTSGTLDRIERKRTSREG
jgi:hypothetical protein